MVLKKVLRKIKTFAPVFVLLLPVFVVGFAYAAPLGVNDTGNQSAASGKVLPNECVAFLGTNSPTICQNIPVGCPGSQKTAVSDSQVPLDLSKCPYNAATADQKAASAASNTIPCGTSSASICPKCTTDYAKCPICPVGADPLKNEACPKDDPCGTSNAGPSDNSGCDFVKTYVNPAIQLFSVVFGLIVAIGVITGAIQYITSSGDPQKAAKAKARITTSVVALVGYVFLFALLQFLVPGGII